LFCRIHTFQKDIRMDNENFILNDYKIKKIKNREYVFHHSLKNKETGEIKVLHNFTTMDVDEFLNHIEGKVSEENFEYVKNQSKDSSHAFGIFIDVFPNNKKD